MSRLAKPFHASSPASRRLKLIDRLADAAIRLGGVSVIFAIALIFVFIVREIVPLSAKSTIGEGQVHRIETDEAALLLAGSDEFESTEFIVKRNGAIELHSLANWSESSVLRSQLLGGRRVSAASLASRGIMFLGTDDGRIAIVELQFNATFADDARRTITPLLKELALVTLPSSTGPIARVVGRTNDSGLAFVAQTSDRRLFAVNITQQGLDLAEDEKGQLSAPEEDALDGPFQVRSLAAPSSEVVALAIDSQADRLFVATKDGVLHHWQLGDTTAKPFAEYENPGLLAASLGLREPSERDSSRQITALNVLLGDQSLIVGYDDGSIEDWLGVRQGKNDILRRVRPVRLFDSMPEAVVALRSSGRDKTFLAAAADGSVHLAYVTSGKTLASYLVAGHPLELAYGAKLTSAMVITQEGNLDYRAVSNPHPDISMGMLFGKVWYEGYDQPEYIWQSSSGSDAFEPKFSLVPLIVGTLKGAFFGLLFAIPIALLAALYTSQFLSSTLRATIKPLVEVMAALPSVVIGFLAGLWLAPALDDKLPSLLFFGVVVPVVILTVAGLWHYAPRVLKKVFPAGREVFVLVPVVALCGWAAVIAGPFVERLVFAGDFKQWVYDAFSVRVEQRNSIVVGIAMSLAVIPMIFTLSDDAFSNVPKSFSSASLALGASRWQTAFRVIVPTASPGVFSAIMIGFGRAVGETMIVLMATGNTPILSFSPFNGMRTLSANIAVEMPEAPLGETHYRILFLAAFLLFVLTFVVNTIADVVRQRLRSKFQAV